ncbi:midnolin-B isoform X2 [Halyomorpha halys]|uniref:midnolin-B n=1 Tax=Halyomorpha halys TaxID=286706 RepID=UPI0006D4F62A
METAKETCPCSSGCGCPGPNITISVTPTTGGQFELAVTKTETIENLKKLISKRLKVPKERICLLHRERQLREGTVQENHLVNGSRLTLLPSVETGLLAQRPEQSVMQALESLNDSQVNDFLSGKAPLNLTMRLGDHMMLIQLQLSTVAPAGKKGRPTKPAAPSPSTSPATEDCSCDPRPVLDTKALAEASRNLTQTLKQLSSEEVSNLKRRQGAIIESMHHHGKGVYSGTFSGTLNPALQDRFGRPKRDISTIIHILNDLLCATPQYRAAAAQEQASKPQPQPSTSSSTNNEVTRVVEKSSAESDENRATRGKMERLRLVLGQRRERRRAMRSQPYPTGHDHVTA